MKTFLSAFAAALLAALLTWLTVGRLEREPTAALPSSSSPTAAIGDPHGDLARRVAELAREVDALRAQLEGGGRSSALAPPPTAPATSVDDGQPSPDLRPSWYLAQYVSSFQNGGPGSEYFRLAVAAYAPSLLNEISELVQSGQTNALLRRRLIEILGDARFAGHRRVNGILLGLVRSELADAAVASIVVVGDDATALELERALWSIPGDTWKTALGWIVDVHRPRANAALVRLLGTAPDDERRAVVITMLDALDPDGALDAFRLVSTSFDVPVRMVAAHTIGGFRHEAVIAFVDEWYGFELDEGVREMLKGAREVLKSVPNYSAEKLTGPPDAVGTRDHPNAWCPAAADDGEVWIELGYDPPRPARGVRVHQVYTPGAIVRVVAIDASGGSHTLWSGTDPSPNRFVFEAAWDTTSYSVRALRVVLDTDRAKGWNEIDAVQLLSPQGDAWATSAAASSTYGQ